MNPMFLFGSAIGGGCGWALCSYMGTSTATALYYLKVL